MANNYFQFNEFKIIQEVCAMKVCTDSCLFGAWSASIMLDKNINNILDVGAGTGLLSLMLIQKFPDTICHAIEIDKETSEEALLNFTNSKWKDKLIVYNQDFVSFQSNCKYDLIVCNPPFYNNQLASPDSKRNAAMHSSHFSLQDLFKHAKTLVSSAGYLSCLVPYNRTDEALEVAAMSGWYIQEICKVKQTDKHDYFRTMLLFRNQPTSVNSNEIVIKENNIYTDKFRSLLMDYYLRFK